MRQKDKDELNVNKSLGDDIEGSGVENIDMENKSSVEDNEDEFIKVYSLEAQPSQIHEVFVDATGEIIQVGYKMSTQIFTLLKMNLQ